MKTMRFTVLAAAVAALAGCSKLEPAKIENAGTGHEVYLAVRASSADTRTAISPDYDIRWTGGVAIGLFYNVDEIKAELVRMLEIQLADNVKGCFVDDHLDNVRKMPGGGQPIRAQYAFYEYLKGRNR